MAIEGMVHAQVCDSRHRTVPGSIDVDRALSLSFRSKWTAL